jgi:hypothetical protein
VRDLPWSEYRATVVIELYRVRCPDCGVKTEKIPQLPSKAPFSKRFEEAVGLACESAAVRRVAQQFGLAGSTVRAIDLRYLERWAAAFLRQIELHLRYYYQTRFLQLPAWGEIRCTRPRVWLPPRAPVPELGLQDSASAPARFASWPIRDLEEISLRFLDFWFHLGGESPARFGTAIWGWRSVHDGLDGRGG